MPFARLTSNNRGIGKLLGFSPQNARIEYFTSPCHGSVVVEFPRASVKAVELDHQTRVYHLDPTTRLWRAGRVLTPCEDDCYLVAFPNKVRRTLPCDELFVRCDDPINDPTDFLAGRVTESPYLHQRRAKLAAAFAQQRGFAGGMTGLLSAGIQLEPHQIEVARRVSQDPIQRYLLADEVGLGKTIEAGVVVRQFVLDDPLGHQILIAVPSHLTGQWRDELTRRFDLGRLLDSSVRVVAFDELEQALASSLPRMLVIDEAHQLAALVAAPPGSTGHTRFKKVCIAAVCAERLLLLSATPSLHNEVGFQAMLHLLDPSVYPLGDLEAFRVRREGHQEVAELYHVFHATESGMFLRDCLDRFVAMFPKDDRLRQLGEKLRPFLTYGSDESDERRADLVQEIRCHVSEVYRLHRRLLRNRRADPRIESVLPGRVGLTVWEYDDRAAIPLAALIDEWRLTVGTRMDQRDAFAECLQMFWDAAADPLALATLADVRRGEADEEELAGLALTPAEVVALGTPDPLLDEVDVLLRLAGAARDHENLDRADATVEGITALWEQHTDAKVVVFATFPRTADEVYDALRAKWGQAVVRHGEPRWDRFRAEATVRVLVCDRRAEEGLNLQGNRVTLVHYDLPMSPNRIEQRLGRVDRYGANANEESPRPNRAVRSTALVARNSAVPRGWCDLLNGVFKVFDRSVAALQYLIEDELPRLRAELLIDGVDGLRGATARLGGPAGLVEETLRRIHVLDELDAVETTLAQQDFADRLIEAERMFAGDWQQAFGGWAVGRLAFAERTVPRSEGQVVRYQFLRPKVDGKSTLIPVRRLLERFREVIDDGESSFTPTEPITHKMTFSREFATGRGTPLARTGHRFLDAMAEFLRWDDTGVAFGLWRVRPGYAVASPPSDIAFRFDFQIEADISGAGATATTTATVRRLADRLLPPEFVTVWLDGAGLPITEPVLAVFREDYRHDRVEPDGYDVNMRPEHWLTLEAEFSPADWEARVRMARTAAADGTLAAHIETSTRLADRIRQAREEAETRRSQLRSRVAFLSASEGEIERVRAEEDERLWAALIAGIERPSVRLDALGAVFVSDRDPFANGD